MVDSNSLQVLYIEFASHRKNGSDILPVSGTTFPHDITKDSLVQSGRERFAPPMTSIDYLRTSHPIEPWIIADS